MSPCHRIAHRLEGGTSETPDDRRTGRDWPQHLRARSRPSRQRRPDTRWRTAKRIQAITARTRSDSRCREGWSSARGADPNWVRSLAVWGSETSRDAGRSSAERMPSLTIDAPPGTTFASYQWTGRPERKDCRYAMQIWAELPDGKKRYLRTWRANRKCKAKRDCQDRVRSSGSRERGVRDPWRVTDRAARRSAVGGGGSGCSGGSGNRLWTNTATAEFEDGQPPAVGDAAGHAVDDGSVGARPATAELRRQ